MKGKNQEKNVRTSKVQFSSRPIHKRDRMLHTTLVCHDMTSGKFCGG